MEEFEPRIVRLLEVGSSLVVVEAVTRRDSILTAVTEYLAEHPDASQRDVEKAIKGRAADIRAIYRHVRPVRPEAGRTPEQGASRGGVPLGDAPGTQLPALIADDHTDGGW